MKKRLTKPRMKFELLDDKIGIASEVFPATKEAREQMKNRGPYKKK